MTHESMTSGPMTRRSLWIALLLVWSLGPMLWQLLSSFTTADALVNDQLSFWSRWTLNNYRDLLSTDPPFWRYLLNSSLVASLTTLLTLILAISCLTYFSIHMQYFQLLKAVKSQPLGVH